jgi:hypothetical protein
MSGGKEREEVGGQTERCHEGREGDERRVREE